MKLKERFKTILKNLNEGIYEKEEVIALSLLSAIAGESIFLLGPPGVAKSLMARRLKNVFKDGKSFEYLMSRFSTPDEIFGPVSISKLKNEDKYVRLTENYLPNADIVFLDEIWKAGPSIQNTLLTVINEKLFRNGDKDEKVKMKSLISASNELPALNEGLEALWDRFLIRYFVDGITDNDSFFEMIDGNVNINDDAIKEDLKITDKEYQDWQNSITKVKIPDEVKNVIKAIRFYLSEYNSKNENDYIYISDRRWKKIIKILKTSAFMNEREEVNLMDLFLSIHLIWNNDKQIDLVKEIITKAVKDHSFSDNDSLEKINNEYIELESDILQEIEVNTKRSNEKKLYKEEYYEVDDPKGELRGYKYIKKSQFDNASINSNWRYCYDDNLRNYNNYRWIKTEGSIIKSNTTGNRYGLKINIITKNTQIHPIIVEIWNKKIEDLYKSMNQHIEIFRKLYDEIDKKLENYLILDGSLKKIPKLNIENSINELSKKKLELERLKKKYTDFNNSIEE